MIIDKLGISLYKIASEGREENITKPYWESDKFDRDTAKILCTPSPTSPCVLKWPVPKHLNIKWKLSQMRWTVVFTLNLLPTLMNPSFLLPDRVIGEPNDNEPISLFFGATPGNRLLRNESLLSCINSSRSLWRASLSFSIKSDWNEITEQGFH